MTDATKAAINEALGRIRVLADQIRDSSPFAAARISREILEYSRQVQFLRAAASASETPAVSAKP